MTRSSMRSFLIHRLWFSTYHCDLPPSADTSLTITFHSHNIR